MTNGNDAANPCIESVNHAGVVQITTSEAGLTKREYFAVNAPDAIPVWFVHNEPEKPKEKNPDWAEIDIEDDKEICRQWVTDGVFDLPEHLSWFSDQFEKAGEANQKWKQENIKERYFQWRTFYADHLIAELNKPTT